MIEELHVTEQDLVVAEFDKTFSKWKESPFVLYGLGKNTEAILTKTKGFSFVGLMDSKNVGAVFWNLPVLPDEEVIRINPKIVIVARESVVPVIYKRIEYLYKNHGIEIYNISGELLGSDSLEYHNHDLPYWKVCADDLINEINSHDVITFDIFDTLIMRKVLEPIDVFDLVEKRIEAEGYHNINFKEVRIRSERTIIGCPTIDEIYEKIKEDTNINAEELEKWKRFEIEAEKMVIVPRTDMIDLYNYALKSGKEVWIVSDMYYSKKILDTILSSYGICGYMDILVSCDYSASKKDGTLFEIVKLKARSNKILHVGDNRRSDGEMAIKNGIKPFLIYSAYEMWMASALQSTLNYANSFEERLMLGHIVWKYCESPFAFFKTEGILQIGQPELLGYSFLGPLYDQFIIWLIEYIRNTGIKRLLLPSRDGFLISKILEKTQINDFEYIYFRASRRALSVAALSDESDIILLGDRSFSGSLGEMLLYRFGVNPREDDLLQHRSITEVNEDVKLKYIMQYKDDILLNASYERREYEKYMKNEGVYVNEGDAIFDFVASGTVQFYLQKIFGCNLQGLYFATMNHPKKEYNLENKIESCFGNICSYGSKTNVGKHYLFLESIMVDGFPTLEKVEDGKCVFNKSDDFDMLFVQQISKVQDGIVEFHEDMEEIREHIPNWNVKMDFADLFYGQLFENSCKLSDDILKAFVNDDLFDGIRAFRVL